MFDFDQIDFERRYYSLITKDVNQIFAELLMEDKHDIRKDSYKVLRQIMQSLHAIVEECIMQTVHGLLVDKESE